MEVNKLQWVEEHFRKTLQALKTYVLSLWQKKKKRQIEEEEKNMKKTTSWKNPPPQKTSWQEKIEEKQDSWLDKLKKKIKETLSDVKKEENSIEDKKDSDDSPNGKWQTSPRNESAQEYKNKYDPRDTEFGESSWESPRFAEISPSYSGYYTSAEKPSFDPSVNQWEENQQLSPYISNMSIGNKSYSYAINLKKWLIPLPLPEWSEIDTTRIYYSGNNAPIFLCDQNGCFYVECQENHQQLSFSFCLQKKSIISSVLPEDSEKMIFVHLSSAAQHALALCRGKSPEEMARIIRSYIFRSKKYSTKVQWTLRNTSNSKNYIANLDKSPILECYSANTLFCAMMRELWVPARLVVWHMAQWVSPEWSSLLSSNNGHAWSKIWNGREWIRFDATPTEKEDGEKSEQNMDEQQEQWEDSGDGNMDKNQSSESGKESGEKWDQGWEQWWEQWDNSGDDSKSGNSGKPWDQGSSNPWKSPKELLDELIEKAKENSFSRQAESMEKVIEKLEEAKSKEDIRKILDESWLDDFAKDEIDTIWNEEILEREKKELDEIRNSNDEEALNKALKDSLLDDEYKKKLNEYAAEIRKFIQEAKNRMKSDMERMGFTNEEISLYKAYKDLEKEVEWEVRKQIAALERILPPKYKIVSDDRRYRSGNLLADTGALVNHVLTNDPNVFRRTKEEKDPTEINMYETIIIDRSGSMGSFTSHGSALRASVKAGIIRAKVLEHFKVDFSILFFDDDVESVMDFGEKFSDRKKSSIPSNMMRSLVKSWGTNISAPLVYTWDSMKRERRKKWWAHFWNITFIGDGEPSSWLTGAALTWLINQMRWDGFGITAYYIGTGAKEELEWYFWKKETGWTVIVSNLSELTPALISSYNNWLKKILHRFTH